MTQIRVIVGLAETASAGPTLAWAMRQASWSGAELVVIRAGVGKGTALGTLSRGGIRALELVDPALARAVGAARLALGEDRVSIVVDRDPPGPVLVRLARPEDLIVVGAPDRPGWWARASTTYHVATRATCPVIVVHSAGPAGRAPVVVGLDGSPASHAAIELGFVFAAAHGLPLVAAIGAATVDDPADAAAAELEPWHQKYPEVSVTKAVLAGSPAEALRRAAADAALLVVGATGTGPARLGSVSRDMMERAPCPVAVVH
jgi:nucleotide-binding universal stress UspA family protein